MACPIEIGKSLDKSISKYLPNVTDVMSKKSAEDIAKHLNDLWGKIADVRQYSGSGGYVVTISNIEKAVLAEYQKQLSAESYFQRTHEFFNKDKALYEQEQREFKGTYEKIPGIDELFKKYPRLEVIGTQEQYESFTNSFAPGTKPTESGTPEDEYAFREYISKIEKAQEPVNADLESLEFTDIVRDYLYSRGSKRLKKDIFAQQAHKFVENNRANMTVKEIIEKLICL